MSNPISTTAARVIDPVLTNVARGYKQMAAYAFMYLFPIVMVAQRGGKIVQFSQQSFSQYDTVRAPGANIVEAEFGYGGASYALEQHALSFKVPIEQSEEAQAVPGINLGSNAVMTAMDIISLGVERQAATLATTAANYNAANVFTLAGSSQWDHDDSTPAKYIEGKKELIAGSIGREPNIIIAGPEVCRALKNNPDVIDRIKHTEGLSGGSGPSVNAQKLAQYFDVDKFIEAAARKTDDDNKLTPVWGKNVIMAYSEIGSLASMGTPSFGYTYRLNNYPVAEQPFYDKGKRSWMYPVITEDTSVIAGKDAGVLLNDVVS